MTSVSQVHDQKSSAPICTIGNTRWRRDLSLETVERNTDHSSVNPWQLTFSEKTPVFSLLISVFNNHCHRTVLSMTHVT